MSTVKHVAAIILIFAIATIAWLILGANIFIRTESADLALRGRVKSTWGAPHNQSAPTVTVPAATALAIGVPAAAKGAAAGAATTPAAGPGPEPITRSGEPHTDVTPPRPTGKIVPIERSRVEVDLDLEHRQKGLLWYSTYGVQFDGRYTVRNAGADAQLRFTLPLPATRAMYDGLAVTIDGRPLEFDVFDTGVITIATIPTGTSAVIGVAYRSQGLESWHYDFGDGVAQVRDFALVMRTDFDDIDIADDALSPTTKTPTADGWQLEWRYTNLLSGYRVGTILPEKAQPGPLAGRISLFAPVSLFFFFMVLLMMSMVRGIEIHPMNYLFLAAAFFAFHLLLAYLVDHISIHLAMALASLVSLALVASYLRLVVGPRFALRYAAPAQLIYLILFSYAFFLDGFTGLTITVISIVTLAVAMQMTGRVRWREAGVRAAAGV